MRKEEKEVISDITFHQWKKNDCTSALRNLINESIVITEKSITNYIVNTKDISVDHINNLKGNLFGLSQMACAMDDKTLLEKFIDEKEEKENE